MIETTALFRNKYRSYSETFAHFDISKLTNDVKSMHCCSINDDLQTNIKASGVTWQKDISFKLISLSLGDISENLTTMLVDGCWTAWEQGRFCIFRDQSCLFAVEWTERAIGLRSVTWWYITHTKLPTEKNCGSHYYLCNTSRQQWQQQ